MDKHAQIICEMFGSLLLKRHSIHLVCEDSRSSRDLGSTQTGMYVCMCITVVSPSVRIQRLYLDTVN